MTDTLAKGTFYSRKMRKFKRRMRDMLKAHDKFVDDLIEQYITPIKPLEGK